MKRMVVPILFLVSFFAVPCAYPDEVFKVWSASDSLSSPLNTDIYVSAGERLVISVPPNETSRAGGNRPHSRQSNAGGLTGLGPNSGYYWGNYRYGSSSFPYGTLVRQIGDGAYFPVDTFYNGIAGASGDLSLLYWDSYYGDNYGSVMATVSETSVPVPSAFILFASALSGLFVLKKRRAFYKAIRPLPFCS